jgi:hypothetical protein
MISSFTSRNILFRSGENAAEAVCIKTPTLISIFTVKSVQKKQKILAHGNELTEIEHFCEFISVSGSNSVGS